jgi:type I restriction enzyme M protein
MVTRSSQRVKGFSTLHKIDYETFEVEIDADSNPIVDEEFNETIREFRVWCNTQEETLRDLFTKEK